MSKIEHLNQELADKKVALNSKIEEVRAGAEDDSTKVEDVQAGMDDVKQLKDEIEALSKQIEMVTEALNLEDEDLPEEATKDADKSPEEPVEPSADEEKRDDDEIPDDSADAGDAEASDDEEINSAVAGKDDKKEEQRSGNMKGINNMQAKIADNMDAFEAFLKTGEVRDGVSTVDGQVIIPKEILDVQKVPTDLTQLSNYVNRVNVTSGVGALPVLAKNTARLATAEELAENPEIDKLQLKEVDYKAKTMRGVLPISWEMSQDNPEINTLVSTYVAEAKNLTEQYKIGEVLQKATPVAVSDVDGIKDAFNHDLSNYNKMFVVSETLYAEIDKLKDADGRYLLQDSITAPSGKQLLGAPVVIVSDDVLGKAGEAHAFVGDVKAFVLEPIRAELTVSWIDDDVFAKKLAVAMRADFQVADDQAGKFLTFSASSK
ncbi:phage major capsid protein [Weissella paramesenteroides]|uniref:phage major capsid protein n=1 Tax=Weissella paramesenteroides TaxID=1249 RepID=UPI0021AF34F2|nr:phage major capsid protein [Weissella paramesenteroides]MCS9984108.1 phage major capsid protein [Weissella paramesenteroides]MCS9997866.1 phage major capsid protein [Weissella paramesenteroides]MCT0260201.1 phage major capsid protein [Weissella paramesenteroides]